MAGEIIHRTGRLQDRVIIDLINAIGEAYQSDTKKFMYGRHEIPIGEIDEILGKGASYVINRAEITTPQEEFVVSFCRGTSGKNHSNGEINVNIREPSPYFDEIIIIFGSTGTGGQQTPSPSEYVKLDKILQTYISSGTPKQVDDGAKGAIDLLQKEIADLAAFHKKMLEDAEDRRVALESDFQKKHTDLEAKAAENRKKIDEHSTQEQKKVLSLKSELESAQKHLDDRNHMHVRRELRENISNDIEKRVATSLTPKSTQNMNTMIIVFTVFCAVVSAVLAYESIRNFSSLLTYTPDDMSPPIPNIEWLIIATAVRSLLTSVITLGFLLYALNWMRRSYTQSIQTSNDLQRYALDINRASWTIETIMEMTSKDGRVLPDKWVEGVCHGLFRNPENDKSEVTPLEAWGALLKVSGKAELGPDGPKMEFSKGQVKKIAKSDGISS
jgi:Skp family chaperone for outer membrane proteins